MRVRRRPKADIALLVPLVAAAGASFAVIGADARWLAAIGALVAHGHLPDALPFATAATEGWQNAPALAEVLFHLLYSGLGERGLILAQVAAALVGYGALSVGLRREARTPGSILVVSVIVLAGSVVAIVIVRNALFSLALFPLLMLIIEQDARAPSRRLWLVVPLLAVWTNLHGNAVIGLAVLAAYVVFARRRAAGVLLAGALALCATPLLWNTPRYYFAVSQNEAASRGVGLWAPLGTGAFDLVYIVSAVALIGAALSSGRRAWHNWEVACIVVLAAASIDAARLGPWLLFIAAYPAVRAVDFPRPAAVPALVPVALAVLAVIGLVHLPYDGGSRRLASHAARLGRPVLADGLLAEQVELAGGTVWVADPIEAFRHRDQRLYLDWLAGNRAGRAAVDHAGLVLVDRSSAAGHAAAQDARLSVISADRHAVLYRVGGSR